MTPEPEFRLDPLTRERVLVVGNRQDRPNLPGAGCPFCVGGLEAPEPYEVRAFENRWPAMSPGPPFGPGELDGSEPLPASGATEVLLYSPDHDASLGSIGVAGVRAVVDLWAERTAHLLARPDVEYVLVFENRGREVGATIDHPHGQVYAFPFVPPVPRREAEVAAEHGCPLCATLPDELTDGARVVSRHGRCVAIVPYVSGYPYGALVAPVDHLPALADIDDAGRDALAATLSDVVARYDRLFDRPFPYLLWVHPGVHLHVHLAPPLRTADAQRYVASAEVGTGTLQNPVAPEDAAAALPRGLTLDMAETATILVTDLADSTATRVRLGEDRAEQLRRDHDALLAEQAAAHGGNVIKGLGDGLLVAFSGAAEALAAAIAMQQALDVLEVQLDAVSGS